MVGKKSFLILLEIKERVFWVPRGGTFFETWVDKIDYFVYVNLWDRWIKWYVFLIIFCETQFLC